jgi:hypothetical protein
VVNGVAAAIENLGQGYVDATGQGLGSALRNCAGTVTHMVT